MRSCSLWDHNYKLSWENGINTFLMCLNQHSLFQKDLDEISASPFIRKHSFEMNDSQSISQSQSVADHQLSSPLRSHKKGGKKYSKVTETFRLLFISYMLSARNLLYILMRAFNNPLEGRKHKGTNFLLHIFNLEI